MQTDVFKPIRYVLHHRLISFLSERCLRTANII